MRTLEARRVLSVDVAAGQEFTVVENAPANTLVGTVQTAPAADPAQPLTFSIVDGNPSNAFLIVPNSGEIRVNNAAALDFETVPEWHLTIGVQVDGEPTPGQSAVVTIRLDNVVDPATVTLTGGDATLSRVGDNIRVQQGSTTVFDAPLEGISNLSIVGSTAADRLIVDFTGGNPIPTGGLSFDGLDPTTGTGDSLELRGGAFDSIAYRYDDNGHDGGITLVAGSTTSQIEYTGLEPIVNTGTAASMTFTLSGANDHVVLEDLGGGMLRLRSTDAVPTFETTTFAAPSTLLRLETGDGDDVITVTPLTGPFDVEIDGGNDVNTLVVDQVDTTAAAGQFQFAGFSFDQDDTPDRAVVLANGTLDGGYGAVIDVSPGGPTGNAPFPDDPTGFDPTLSVGRLIFPSLTSGTLALNMPAGDNGSALRSGIELWWSNDRTLSNEDGDDFVIYESSSNPSGPDAAMVQVHIAGGGWTEWRYETKDARGVYAGAAPTGAFATAYDLSDFGLSSTDTIDRIRYVNMTAADRMVGPGSETVPGSGVYVATGFVLPGDNGQNSNVLPDPGEAASFAYFGNSTFDPDPLYFGALHPLTAAATTGGIDEIQIDHSTVSIKRDGTDRPTISYSLIDALEVKTHDGVDDVTVVVGGTGLPTDIKLDGGDPSVGDKVTIKGTTGTHQIGLSGSIVTVDATTISLAGLEAAVIDVSAGTSTDEDAVSIDRSFTLGGNSPSLKIVGGTGQLDSLEVDSEYAATNDSGPTFSFGGVSFDQASTPDLFSELGLGELAGGNGVAVNTRPGAISSIASGFPDTPGYDASISLGNLWARQTSTTTNYVSLPNTSNDGSATRGGFALSWSNDRVLVDDVGDDLVIYESGSPNSPEPVMVQVHDVNTNTWSSWIYKAPVSQAQTENASSFAFVTVYDMDADFDMAGAVIDAIRVVNMITSDRMEDGSGEGVVLPGETNPTSTTLPKPGTQASFSVYPNGSFDPDPIYFGVRHALGGVAARNDVVSVGPDAVEIDGYMAIEYSEIASLAVNTGQGADVITVAPSTTTTYAIDGGSPTIDDANPGDRVVLNLTGVGSPLLTVDGIAAATLTSSFKDVVFTGIDSYGANSPLDVKVTEAANSAVGTDAFEVARNGAADEVSVNGVLAFRADRAAINNLLVEGSDDDDVLTLKFKSGDPIPTGGITFTAAGGANELILEPILDDAVATSITHRFDGPAAGRTTIDGSIVDYTGVADVQDNLKAADRTLTYTAVDNDIVLSNDTSTPGRSQATTSGTGATLKFSNPTASLTVNAGPQNDSITLEELDGDFAASVTLSGQAGDDDIILDTNGPATGGTVDWITFPLAVDGGGQSGDRLTIDDTGSTDDKTYSVSNVQIGGGVIPPGASVNTPDASPTVGVGGLDGWDDVPYAFDSGPRPAVDQKTILHFTFAEGAGSVTDDTAHTGSEDNDGLLITPVGPQFKLTAGMFGGALEFNGTSDYAWFQDADFNVGSQGTLSFWVNMDDVSRRNQFFEGPGNVGLEFQYRETGSGATKGQFYGTPNHALAGNTEDYAIQSGGAAALAGTWVNLQFTWQKTGPSSGEMHLYVNGAEVSYTSAALNSSITTWSTVAATANAMMTMGRDASITPGAGNSRYFDGRMDDVAWFDVVLNDTQRKAIYNAATMVFHSIDQIQAGAHDQVFDAKETNPANGHLIAYWNMDNSPGTAVSTGDGGTTIALHLTAEGTEAQFRPTDGKFEKAPGVQGGALDFTNPNSYATFQDPSFDVSSQGSLSMWLYMRDGFRRNELFEGPGDGGFEFQLNQNGQYYGYASRATGNTDDPAIQGGNARNTIGSWHNVIFTWQRTTTNSGELRIYIDGTEVPSYQSTTFNQNIVGWNNLVSTVNGLFTMGRDPGAATPDRWLDALVDDVAWFNQVLSPAQRAALQSYSIDQIQATGGHDQFFDAKAVNAANGHLLAYWNFDDPTGTTVVAGDGGTPVTLYLNVPPASEGVAFDPGGGPLLTGGGQLDAAVFDGNLDFIRVLDSTSLDFDKSKGTISFWINPDANTLTTGFSNLVEDANEQIEAGISWQVDAGSTFGNADFQRRIVFSPFENTAAGNKNVIVSNTRIDFNTWTHVTLTWDYSTLTAAIYINGQLDANLLNNTSSAANWTQPAGDTGDWIFGADGKAASKFFAGKMADIAVFGSALSAGEVQTTYENGAGNTGGYDLAGAKGRFTWDDTKLYGLIESYPPEAANANGPFDNLIVELYINDGTTVAALLDASVLAPANNVVGSVVAPNGDDVAFYEFSIPLDQIFDPILDGGHTFDPTAGDYLRYRVRTIDGDTADGGFDTRDTTLGWIVEPPDAGGGLRRLDFATSENFFGPGGRLTYTNFAELTLNAGDGVDTITVIDSNLTTPTTNPTHKFTINAGGGDDVVTIASIDSVFTAAVTIDGQAGTDDRVTINAALTLGSDVSTGNLSVSAEWIDVTAAINTTDGTVGDVTFDAGKKLTMSADADVEAGGDFLADGLAAETAADVTTEGGSITFETATKLTGDVLLTSQGGNVKFGSTLDASTAGLENLEIDADDGNIQFADVVGGTALGDLLIDDAADVDVDKAFTAETFKQLDGSGTTTFDGLTTLNTATGTALDVRTRAVDVNDEVTSLGGELHLAVDALAIDVTDGMLDATSGGIVSIVTYTAGQTIDLGLGTADLGISTAELDRITAAVLRIGDANAGDITVSGSVKPANVPTLHLITGGDVSGAGTVEIANLAVEAVGDVELANENNDVDRVSIHVVGAGSRISYADKDDLLLASIDVGAVDNIDGIDADGNVTLKTGGALTQQVLLGGIAADGLELLGAGPVELDDAANLVNTLAASLTGPLTFKNAATFTVGAVQTFGPGTSGITTTDDDVELRSTVSLLLEETIDVGAARVLLVADDNLVRSDGMIDDLGGTAPKVVADELAMIASTGIGVTQPLVTNVGLLAAVNAVSDDIAVDDQSGNLLTIGTTNGLSGLANLGGGGISVEHVGAMSVVKPIKVDGSAGDIELTAGSDLLLYDTGATYDVWVTGSGSIIGKAGAGHDITINSGVIVRSGTGQIENIPPQLLNVNGPQIANSGAALVNFDYGRLLELNFLATVDWGDGTSDDLSLFPPGTTTAFHTYTGNPNLLDPSAPIPVSVTLQSDARIHFFGYETTTVQIFLDFPGDGVKNVRIDTTPKVPLLSFPPPVRLAEVLSNNTTTLIRTTVDESGASDVEATETTERIVILREVLPDGREGSAVRFGQSVLNNLAEVFAKLRNGRYRIYLFEPETQTLRQVMEIYVRDGKPTSAAADDDASRDRPDGSALQPPHAVDETPPEEAIAVAEPLTTDDARQAASAVATGAAGLAIVAATTDWPGRVDAALTRYRKFSRLRAKRTRPSARIR